MSGALPRGGLPPAVVVDAGSINGLQPARILARHGVPVIAVGDPHHPYCRSRAYRRVVAADIAGGRVIEALERLGPELHQPGIILATQDRVVLALSRHRARIAPWFRVALPPHEVVETLIDKVRFYRFAQAHDLPIPKTCFLRDLGDALAAAETMTFPASIKPSFRGPPWREENLDKVYKVTSAEDFLQRYRELSPFAEMLVLQQWVEGGEESLFSCNAYFDADARAVTTFVARKIRQWPPYTGSSCLGVECRNDVVLDETLRLFQSVGFHGLAYLEMKRDALSGRHYIVEPNICRATGRSAIAEAGGVELHYAMYADLAGLPPPAQLQQRYTGVKWICLRRDVQAASRQWLRGEIRLRDWRDSWRGPRVWADFSWTDPKPFVFELLKLVHDLFRERGRTFFRRLATPIAGTTSRRSSPPVE